MKKEIRLLSYDEALEKLRHFCAYQERSQAQVIRKMKVLSVDTEFHENLLAALVEEKFLDQQRYAAAYARGKSRIKGWGIRKITSHLKFELGEDFLPDLVNESADLDMAKNKLRKDLEKKAVVLARKQDKSIQSKLVRFCLARGFEMDESLAIVRIVLNETS
jgi:regulatory protein